MPWKEVVVTALGGNSGRCVPWLDEDRQVFIWNGLNDGTGTARSAVPAAKCAAVPSMVDCSVETIGACGMSAPILCNILPIGGVLLAVRAIDTDESTLSAGDWFMCPNFRPVTSGLGPTLITGIHSIIDLSHW